MITFEHSFDLMYQTPCLHYLDIRNTVWTEQSIQLLGRSLRMDCCLTVLHMEGANLTGRPLFLLGTYVNCFSLCVVNGLHLSCALMAEDFSLS